MKLFWAAIVLSGLLAGQTQFVPANYGHGNSHDLRLFPVDGSATTMNIPFPVPGGKFSGDGRSLYSVTPFDRRTESDQNLVRIDFNPMRSAPVNGTTGFAIRDFAVTPDGSKVVISGRHRGGAREKCGLFEITVSTGSVRQVLAEECNYQSWLTDLAVSPDGNRALGSYGNSYSDHNHRLVLIDLAHGTTKSLGDLSRPTWSPDGRWVAAIEWNRNRLILLDVSDFSHRRNLGSASATAWSPDSKYLLLWKYYSAKCGFGFDVEPPASFEVLEISSGKRALVGSSQCQLVSGSIGWMASDIRR
jgi:Tol biopolymer transport system component